MTVKFFRPEMASPPPSPDFSPGDWRAGAVVRTPNWLGDALMSMPAVYQFRQLLPPTVKLWVVCTAGLADLWAAANWVDGILPFTPTPLGRRLAGQIRALGAGVAIVLPNSFRSAWDVARSGIPIRLGRGGRGRALLLNRRLPRWRPGDRRAACHQASAYFDLFAPLGKLQHTLAPPPLVVAKATTILAQLGLPPFPRPLVLAPGAAYGPAKQWPVDHFRQVATAWCAKGGRVVVTGTASDASLAATIGQGLAGATNLCGQTRLPELMALLSQARACLSNDSGTMHLAAALGLPGVAIFGSTHPAATGPLGGRWVVLCQPPPCAPCFERTCSRPERDYRCLTSIAPELALAALDHLPPAPADAAIG